MRIPSVETQNLASHVLDSSINVACNCSTYIHSRRLTSKDYAIYHAYNYSRNLHCFLVRRKILRLYFFHQRIMIWSFHQYLIMAAAQ